LSDRGAISSAVGWTWRVPPIGHGRVGDSIDVFSVGCTDCSAGTHRPASDAEDETEDVDYCSARIRGERTYGSQGLSVDQTG
jgi:hypothetical protein